MLRIFTTSVIILICGSAMAQPLSLYFDKITTLNGLSHNKVNTIIQDKRGFIWFGTDDGLNRYDGTHFTIFKNIPGNKQSISGNIITDILEDNDEVLWISTADGGLTKYDYRLEPAKQFRQFKNIPGDSTSIPVNTINKLIRDKNGKIWLATSGKFILRFDPATEKFSGPVPVGTKTVLALTLRNNDELWAGRQGGGLLKGNPGDMRFTMDKRYLDLYNKTLPHATVTSLFTDSRNNTWYGSWDNVLYKYESNTNEELVFRNDGSTYSFINDEILSFAEEKNGTIWMGGKNNGLHRLDPSTNSFRNYQHDPSKGGTIAGNQVNCVFIDKTGLIWIGTNLGVSVNNPGQQQFHQHFMSNDKNEPVTIYDFYLQPDGDLWIATDKGIFTRAKGEGTTVLHPVTYNKKQLDVTKFYRAGSGKLFIGSSYSLFGINERDFSVTMLPNTDKDSVMNQIIRSYVVSVAEDSLDNEPVLIASPFGHYLAYYSWAKQRWITRLDSSRKIVTSLNLKDHRVKKLYKPTRNGNLYIATAEQGLGIWQRTGRQQFQFFKSDPSQENTFSNSNITDLVADKKDNLWVTTYGGGLHYFNTTSNTATHIAESNNLLEGVQVDNNGNVWITSNGNIDKYDPVSKIYTSYPLPDIEQTSGVHGGVFKDNNGNLYVTGKNYFIAFDPLRISGNRTPLPIYLTDLRIFNQSKNHLLKNDNISLSYNQNYLSLEFSSPAFSNKTQVEYQYQLAGLNDNWTDLGTENKVNFSNLNPGSYTFRVRATNRPGVWYEHGKGLKITITPPFWKTWWFYLLCSIIAASLVYAIYRYRINEILKRQAIRNKIAQDLHDNIGSTLSSIGVYSQVAKIYNEQNRNPELKDALEKISETSGNMISEMNDIVWTINPRNDNMQILLQRMESFARPLLAARSIVLHFEYETNIESLNLEMTQRKNFYLIFKESVNNALKYADCKNLYVSIYVRNFRLEMIIRDDGAGFDMEKMVEKSHRSMSGNGLKNMSIRAREMKGNCELMAIPGNGTTVKLQFPIT